MNTSVIKSVRAIARHFMLKSCYIHIPKTGGTYLAQLETGGEPVIWPMKYLGHCVIVDSTKLSQGYGRMVGYLDKPQIEQTDLDSFFVVSTVRNPYSWLVSYAGHAGGWSEKYRDSRHYDYEIAQKGFDYLVRSIADRDSEIWPSRKFIHFAIFSLTGKLVVDWLNRTESLDGDLENLANRRMLTFRRQKKQRVGIKKDYRSFYNDALVDLVGQTWGRELELFGYNFDGEVANAGILGRTITSKQREGVTYNWASDICIVNGSVIGR